MNNILEANQGQTNCQQQLFYWLNLSIRASIFLAAFFVLGFFLVPCKTFATTYYVDAVDGANANNGTSEGTAWKDIGNASGVNARMSGGTIQAGDTILFKRGQTFTNGASGLVITVNGTAGNIITFDAYGTGANPIINGGTRSIDSRNRSYLTFNNLTLTNATQYGLLFGVTAQNYVTFNNISVSATPKAMSWGGVTYTNITISNSSFDATTTLWEQAAASVFVNLTITNSTFAKNVFMNTAVANPNTNIDIDGCTFTSGIYIYATNDLTITDTTASGSGIDLRGVTDVTMDNITVTNTTTASGMAISNSGAMSSSDITLSNSHLDNNSTGGINGNGLTLTGDGSNFTATNVTASNNGGDGFNVHNTWSNVVFDKCLAENNGTTAETTDGDGFTFHETSSGTIKNSVAKNNKKFGIGHVSSSVVDMYNNIIYSTLDNARQLVYLYDTGTYTFQNNTVYSGTQGRDTVLLGGTVTMKNNIIYGGDSGLTTSGGTATMDYNLVYGANTGYDGVSAGAHDLSSNPLFLNSTGSYSTTTDFLLAATSPAIDAGTTLSATYDDANLYGSSWPSVVTTADQDLSGYGWEMGAFIYPYPQKPTIGTPSAISATSIRWNFTDAANDETGFRIYNNSYALAVSSATAGLTYLDETGLSENTQYTGRFATAYNSYGNSASSSIATSKYTLANAPSDLAATWDSDGNIILTVDSFPNDTLGTSGYYFENTTRGSNSGWLQTNTWQDNNLACGTNNYTVKYRNGNSVETTTATASQTRSCGGGFGSIGSSSGSSSPSDPPQTNIPATIPTDTVVPTPNAEVTPNPNLPESSIIMQTTVEFLADSFNEVRNIAQEQEAFQNIAKRLPEANLFTPIQQQALSNFIVYGTLETKKLGSGERAGSIYSFQSAFNKLPQTEQDWSDVLKISLGRWPSQTSSTKENAVKIDFKTIYQREPQDSNSQDQVAIDIMAYGIRPLIRNLNSEKIAFKYFKAIYGKIPQSTLDWDIIRAIAYSGAKR
ncbi:MAG: right-handed parallel beta-helix repeat-containing protein [Patescibacteria group bacterium]|jgi:hypothetical protein